MNRMTIRSAAAVIGTHLAVLGVALLCLAVTGCATAPGLASPDGSVPLATVAAQGVQVYECRAAGASALASAPAWAFVGPQAELFDAAGLRIGRHGAGPSWMHDDGSGFTGTLRQRVDAPRPGAIPWLLLDARAQGPQGAWSRVTAVQRVNTVGGLAPDGGCDAAAVGRRVQVAYRADYVLHVPASAGAASAQQQVASGHWWGTAP